MTTSWLAFAGFGLVIVLASVWAASAAEIPAWERTVFRVVNRLPGWLLYALWLPMQLGNLVVGAVAGLAVALGAGAVEVAIGVVIATVLKLVSERLVRRLVHGRLPARVRPGTSQPDAVLRGSDVPTSGPSFPSGHVVLVAAVACVIAPVLPSGWELVPGFATVLVMVGRVYVGAHNPLDVTAGLGVGVTVGALVASLVERHPPGVTTIWAVPSIVTACVFGFPP